MSRSRSSSGAVSGAVPGSSLPPEAPLHVKVLRLSRPVLQNALDPQNVEAPSMLTTELLLPKAMQSVYVGEEFHCLLAVQRVGNIDDEGASVLAEVVAPSGERTKVLTADLEFEGEFVRLISFDAVESGVYTLAATLRYDVDMEHKALRRLFKFEAAPAISVRMKVSRGSSALKGHVLEAQVENLSDSSLTIESCVLSPAHSWEVTKLEPVENEAAVMLRPRDTQQWCFVMRSGVKQEVGQLSVGWRREPLGAKGWQTTGMIRI